MWESTLFELRDVLLCVCVCDTSHTGKWTDSVYLSYEWINTVAHSSWHCWSSQVWSSSLNHPWVPNHTDTERRISFSKQSQALFVILYKLYFLIYTSKQQTQISCNSRPSCSFSSVFMQTKGENLTKWLKWPELCHFQSGVVQFLSVWNCTVIFKIEIVRPFKLIFIFRAMQIQMLNVMLMCVVIKQCPLHLFSPVFILLWLGFFFFSLCFSV